MRTGLRIAVIVLALTALVGCSSNVLTGAKSREVVNEGGRLAPPNSINDWLQGKTEGAPSQVPSVAAVIRKAQYPLLLRKSGSAWMEPSRIWIQQQALEDGRVVDGFFIAYGADRIALTVDPASVPLRLQYYLDETMTPNTLGETKPYHQTEVRGGPAVYRASGVQKWKNGDTNAYSAAVIWTEKGNSAAPYLTYTLYGNLVPQELVKMADSLSPSR